MILLVNSKSQKILCRQNAQQLALENELLENQMRQTEIDTIDVVTFLKKEDQKKMAKVRSNL